MKLIDPFMTTIDCKLMPSGGGGHSAKVLSSGILHCIVVTHHATGVRSSTHTAYVHHFTTGLEVCQTTTLW